MSELFWLWNPVWDASRRTLSFFAVQANVPIIARGTRAMVAEMLADMGWPDALIDRWEVRRVLRSTFHAQYIEDEPSQTWEDVWAPSWEIAVTMATDVPPPPALFEPDGEPGTCASDDTAEGDVPFPADGVVAANFDSDEARDAALEVLREALGVRALAGPPRDEAVARVLAAVRSRFGKRPSGVRLEVVPGSRHRALVWFGAFREDDDAATTELGNSVETLCQALGARTRIVDG